MLVGFAAMVCASDKLEHFLTMQGFLTKNLLFLGKQFDFHEIRFVIQKGVSLFELLTDR